MRVVVDTNVYISAFVIPGSLSDEACYRARAGDVDLYTSVAILTGLASKLRETFDWNEDRIRAALKSVSRTAQVVKTTSHLAIVRDPTDNRILECAEKVDANLIVTGNPRLLRLRRFGQAGVVRVSAFLRILGPGSSRPE